MLKGVPVTRSVSLWAEDQTGITSFTLYKNAGGGELPSSFCSCNRGLARLSDLPVVRKQVSGKFWT